MFRRNISLHRQMQRYLFSSHSDMPHPCSLQMFIYTKYTEHLLYISKTIYKILAFLTTKKVPTHTLSVRKQKSSENISSIPVLK